MSALIHETTKFPENLYEAMRFASYAMCKRHGHPHLQGLHFDARGKGGLWMLATDGHRLHATKLVNTDFGTWKWRIETKDVRTVLAAMRTKKVRAKTPLRIDFSAGQFVVGANRYAMHNDHVQLDFQRVMPREQKPLVTFSHAIDMKDFLAASKTLTRGPVKITRGEEDSVTLGSSAENGRRAHKTALTLTLAADVECGEGFQAVGVNALYLADAFAALGWGCVSVKGDPEDNAAPLLLECRTINGPERLCVVLPMRI